MRTCIHLLVFWAMQATAQGLFTWGSIDPGRWWLGFVIGNAVGIASVVVLMRLGADGDPGLALALCIGGAFIAGQITAAVITGIVPTAGQWACIGLIAVSMVGFAKCARSPASTTALAQVQRCDR